MQWISSRIWTRVAVVTSCDENHYTTGTSPLLFNIHPLVVHELFPSMWQCLDSLGRKSHQQQIWCHQMNFSTDSRTNSWPTDRILSGAANLAQRGPGSDSNWGVLRIPQSSSITEASPSDCIVSYRRHSLVGGLTPLQICN